MTERVSFHTIPAPPDHEPFGGDESICPCGATRHAEHDGRCANGHVLLGNSNAVVTGLTSVQFWNEHDQARHDVRVAIITDAGYAEADAPLALVLAADTIAQATLIRDSVLQRMAQQGGPLTSGNRIRRSFAVWCQAVDRLERHLRLVGLERRAKPVDPLDAVRQAVEEVNR